MSTWVYLLTRVDALLVRRVAKQIHAVLWLRNTAIFYVESDLVNVSSRRDCMARHSSATLLTCSLIIAAARYFSTVRKLMARRRAISLLDAPFTTSMITSRSRVVSSAKPCRSVSRSRAFWVRRASCANASSMRLTSTAGGTGFSRKSTAPALMAFTVSATAPGGIVIREKGLGGSVGAYVETHLLQGGADRAAHRRGVVHQKYRGGIHGLSVAAVTGSVKRNTAPPLGAGSNQSLPPQAATMEPLSAMAISR